MFFFISLFHFFFFINPKTYNFLKMYLRIRIIYIFLSFGIYRIASGYDLSKYISNFSCHGDGMPLCLFETSKSFLKKVKIIERKKYYYQVDKIYI